MYPIAYREMTSRYHELVKSGFSYHEYMQAYEALASDDEDNVLSETDEFEV